MSTGVSTTASVGCTWVVVSLLGSDSSVFAVLESVSVVAGGASAGGVTSDSGTTSALDAVASFAVGVSCAKGVASEAPLSAGSSTSSVATSPVVFSSAETTVFPG